MKHIALLTMCLLALLVGQASAQRKILRLGGGLIAPPAVAPAAGPPKADDAAESDQDKSDQLFPGGAALKTDAEQARLLKRAEQCVEDGRLDLAAVLWQKVLDEAGDTLMVSRNQPSLNNPSATQLLMYSSLSEEVERTLGKLPKEALQTYRIAADGEAQAVMAAAGADKEEEALATVVRRFFLSSQGDDAAYKLACLALDRHDFVGASRLLSRILERHPDPSMPRGDLLLRMAVASARMGDKTTADASLTGIGSAPGIRPPSEVVDLVRHEVTQATALASASLGASSKDWHMELGNPTRSGHMTALSAEATSRTLSELWVQEYPLATTGQNGMNPYGMPGMGGIVVFSGRMPQQPNQNQPVSREDLVSRWREGAWRPTPQLLFDDGRVYIKTPDRLTCYATAALDDKPVWRSLWRNQYLPDGMSQTMAMMAMSYGNQQMQATNKPRTTAEIMLFGDRVHQSMAISGGVIYSLEGKAISESSSAQAAAAGMKPFQWGTTPRRTRGNWLTAYSAAGGKVKWTRTASDEDKEGGLDVGFLAAPVACGNLLLAPVTDGGTIWLFAMSVEDGKTVWKSYLCDEPQGGASAWAPVAMAVDGREAYLTVGCGVVFAVDAVGGTVRWAIRYQRDGKPNNMMRNVYGNATTSLELSGWDDDLVIPYGRALIVMSSDCDKLLSIDRRTGELLWESPRTSPFGPAASYCLGVNGRGLFVAGKNIVRRYDIPSGRLVWEKETGDSFGRGCVTDDAVYLPVKDSIVKYDAEKGRELVQVGVALTSDDPVGNLFSDGEKLWVVGAGRVYAMTTLEHRLTKLAEQIAAGDGESQLNRMRLYFKQNQTDAALADLRGAYVLFQSKGSADEAALRLFAAMNELKIPQNDPLTALRLVTETFVTAEKPPQLAKEAASKRGDVMASAMNVVRQRKLPGGTPGLLAVAPLIEDDYLTQVATSAIDASATKNDIPALKESLARGKPSAQLMSIRALARLSAVDAKEPLKQLLGGGDDRVRLAAARALANAGERGVLDTFVALLDSPNVRVRTRSSQSLRFLTGQKIDFAPEGKPEERAKSVAAWKQWISADGATAKLTLPLTDQAVLLGRTLYVSQAPQPKIVELDHNHKQIWEKQLPGPAWGCQGLPNGNRLVAVYSQSMVIEYGADGQEVWRKEGLPGPPYSVQRLESGSTLVACADIQQIVEIARDGTTSSINVQGRPMSAQRLDNGNTLCALQQGNRVVEVDRAGKLVWEIRAGNNPAHAVRLENGNTLVCLMSSRQVVEYDPTGKTVVWRSAGRLTNAYGAQRLPSGTTIVADYQGLHEFDATGTQDKMILRQNNIVGVSSF